MKAVVEDGCIACGMCVSICPEVFCMGDEIAQVHADVTEENEKEAKEARDGCPASVIDIEE